MTKILTQQDQIQKTIKRVLKGKKGQYLLDNNKQYREVLIALLAVQINGELKSFNNKKLCTN